MRKEIKKGDVFRAEYETAVFKQNIGGWRQETVTATLEAISDKMAVVKEASMEQAGSNRQRFHVAGIEQREIGKRKQISKLYIING